MSFRVALVAVALAAIDLGAQQPESLVATAANRLASGDTAEAIALYNRALAMDSTLPAAGLLISVLDATGRTAEALAIGRRYREHGPRNPRALFRYGWVLGNIWERAQAETLYRDLARIDSGRVYEVWSHGELAYMSRARGDYGEAVEHMRTAVSLRPTDGISQVGLAQMLINAGRAREALPILQRELAADSFARGYGQQPAQVLLAWALFHTGDSTAARDVLRGFEPRIQPMSATRRMQFYAVAGRIDEALAIAERTNTITLYGGPDPHDEMLAPLRGHSRFEALLARSRARVNDLRASLGLPPVRWLENRSTSR